MSPTDEMRGILVALNVRMGLPADVALKSANDAIELLCTRFAGERVYFGSAHLLRDDRDERIYAAHVYGKVSVRELAIRFGMSKSNVHVIVRKVRAKVLSETTSYNCKD